MARKHRHHRHYSEEFKREAVRLLKESGKTLTEQAHELEIDPTTLWAWREKIDHENDPVTEENIEGTLLTKDEETREEARAALFEWIEVWYNRERRHSSIGYLSPTEYEKRLSKKAA